MTDSRHSHLVGVLTMTASSVVFSVMSALIRHAGDVGVDAYKTSLARFSVGLAVLGTAAIMGRIQLRFGRPLLLSLRGLFGGLAVFIYYYTITVPELGLTKGTLINYAFPIFATIGGAVFLRERVSIGGWLAVAAAFAGIYLVIAGGREMGQLSRYDGIAVLGAVLAGVAIVMVKKLRQTESSYAVFFAQCAFGFWMVLLPSNTNAMKIGPTGALLLLAIGLTAMFAQLMMTYAYRHTTVATGSLLGLLTPVLNVPIGVLVFGEQFSPMAIVGGAMVLLACGYISLRRPQPQVPTAAACSPGPARNASKTGESGFS